MNIVVLAGGRSPERGISVLSGKNVASALSRKHAVTLLDPSLPILNESGSENPQKSGDTGEDTENDHTPNTEKAGNTKNAPPITPSVLDVCRKADTVFLALHGGSGENGDIQKILEENGVRFSGSGSAACALTMDKLRSKRVFERHGIPTPRYVGISGKRFPDFNDYPCVVKPAEGGSSIGVRFADNESELKEIIRSLSDGKKELESHVVEQKITGREFSVGILENEVLAITEIIPKSGFYDFENKYTPRRASEITPAKVTEVEKEVLSTLALKTHIALGLNNFSRSDVMLDEKSGEFFVLEANALPGMTQTSLLPQMAKSRGMTMLRLCEKMLGIG